MTKNKKQPEALRLANLVDGYNSGVHSQRIVEGYSAASAELRRQYLCIEKLAADRDALASVLQEMLDVTTATDAAIVEDKAIKLLASIGKS